MQNEIRWRGQGVDLGDRFLQRANDILVCVLIKTDMAVADLDETEIPAGARTYRAKYFGREHSAAQRPKYTGSRPCHAFEKPATINSVMLLFVIVKNVI